MSTDWPPLSYGSWSATCDTLQVLGKLAVQRAPPEPQLQHAALRLTARGWTQAALVLAEFGRRFADARRRSTPGGAPSTSRSTSSRDCRLIRPPTTSSCARRGCRASSDRLVAGGSQPRAGRVLRLRLPGPDGFGDADLSPAAGRWDAKLGEYVLEWDDIRESRDPPAPAVGIRPLSIPPRLRSMRVGPRPRGHGRGSSPADQVKARRYAGCDESRRGRQSVLQPDLPRSRRAP